MKGIKKWVRDKTCLPVWSMLPKLSTSCSSSDVALEKACWETSMTAAASIASLASPLLLILLLISTSCSLVVFVRARGKGSKRWSLEVFVRARDQGSRSKRWSKFISPMARSRSESNNSWEKNIFFWSLSLEWGMPKHNCFRCLFHSPSLSWVSLSLTHFAFTLRAKQCRRAVCWLGRKQVLRLKVNKQPRFARASFLSLCPTFCKECAPKQKCKKNDRAKEPWAGL